MFEKYNFSGSFQDLLLACIIKHPKKFMHNAGTLNAAYFTGVERVAAARAMFLYWRKHGRFPQPQILGQLVFDAIQRTTDEKNEDNIMAFIRKLREMETDDVDYVSTKVVEFARERAVAIAIEQSWTFLKSKETPPGGYTKMFEDALKVGQNLEDMGYRLQATDNDIEKIMAKVTAHDYGMHTGYPDLDKVWPFGWGPGWLIAILAPPKRWKTTFAINLAMNMVKTFQAPVFYYPCEITQELAAVRCLCNLTGKSTDFIYKNPKTFTDIAMEMAAKDFRSTLLIKGYPSRTATISGDIRSHALTARAQLGLNPKAIVIDFAETVKPSSDAKRTSEWRAQGEIYLEARALGAEFDCPVILPDRCNKETVGKSVPSMKSFQGSFEKAGIVDVAIGLCASDDEYLDSMVRYFIFLNRHGEAYQHYRGRVNSQAMSMTIEEKIPWNPEDEDDEKTAAKQSRKERLRFKKLLDET